jgi:hypothetical protein
MMSLEADLLTVPTDSSNTQDRYDYQAVVALMKLVDMYLNKADFAFVFELHNDFIVLDAATNPQHVDFYQVKTKKNGTWTTNSLGKQKAGKTGPLPSILGKLYKNKIDFNNYTRSVNFISNMYCNFAVGKSRVCASSVKLSERKKIETFIKSEHGLAIPFSTSVIFFEKCDLSLDNYEDILFGKMNTLINRVFGTGSRDLDAIVGSFILQAQRRSKYKNPKDFNDVISNKAITRDHVQSWLNDLQNHVVKKVSWEEAVGMLGTGDAVLVRDLKIAFRKHELERINPDDIRLRAICQAARAHIAMHFSPGSCRASLVDIADSTCAAIQASSVDYLGYDPPYLKAVAIYEFLAY